MSLGRGEGKGPVRRHGKPSGRDLPESAGVQSIETGMRLLTTMARPGVPLMLKTLAERARMPPAKAHRYLASFARAGLVQREPGTGRYLLGPVAVQIGLAALEALDPVRVATLMLAEIRDQLGEPVVLAVWGHYGPTIVRSEEAIHPSFVSVRPGFVMPLLSSATGKIFAAWMPRVITLPLMRRELKAAKGGSANTGLRNFKDVKTALEEVRRYGVGRQTGELNAGFYGLSAPIFDHRGALVAAIGTVGVAGVFDASWTGPTATQLRRAAREISTKLGHLPEQAPGKTD
jgi:DNA-binding IclR family transcriptional regulator